MLVRTITGSENWQGHSAKLHAFYNPTLPGLREMHLGQADKDPSVQVTRVRSTFIHAKPGFRNECGFWMDEAFEVPGGTILKLFATRSVSTAGTVNRTALSATVYLQARDEAALRRIRFALSDDPAAGLSAAFVEGRFDLLSFDEARLLGAPVRPQFKAFCAPAYVNRLFEFTEVEPQVRARLVVEEQRVVVGGETVAVPTRRRLRAMQ